MDDARSAKSFAFLWALAALFHQLAFPNWVDRPEQWLITISAVLVTLRPSSVPLFALMIGASVIKTLIQLPGVPNHFFLELVMNVTMLAVLAKRRTDFAPALRLQLLVLYGFAVLHKLNADYFNPDVSCGAKLLTQVLERFGMGEPGRGLAIASLWLVLAVEVAIPVLLVFARTRRSAVVLAVVFHFLIGLHPRSALASFTGTLFPLLFLFFSGEAVDRISRWLEHRATGIAAVALAALIVIFSLGAPSWCDPARQAVWAIASCSIAALLTIALVTGPSPDRPAREFLRPRTAWLWMGAAFLVFNGLNPYLGLKTQTVFSMFSNLRTEGGRTNHLFISASAQVFGFQRDMVEVVMSSDPGLNVLAERHLILPYFEFRRVVSAIPGDFTVEYLRNGGRFAASRRDGIATDATLVTRWPWYIDKILWFRPVIRDGPQPCMH